MDRQEILKTRSLRPLSEIVGRLVQLKRTGRRLTGLCPFHKEKSPSFDVDDARGTFKCYGCGAWGDAFDFVMMTEGLTFPDALARLSSAEITGRPLVRAPVETVKQGEIRRCKHAHEVWMRRKPIHSTLAETYLRRTRGLSLRLPDLLGYVDDAYCSPLARSVPALIAPLQDGAGQVTAVQQIFLDDSAECFRDERGRRIKRTLGPMKDACVRLALPSTTMGLAGSVEDALSASQIYSIPVWATCGETRLSSVWIPDEVETLLIFADADEAGLREAVKCANVNQSRRCEIVTPLIGKDFNDQLRGAA